MLKRISPILISLLAVLSLTACKNSSNVINPNAGGDNSGNGGAKVCTPKCSQDQECKDGQCVPKEPPSSCTPSCASNQVCNSAGQCVDNGGGGEIECTQQCAANEQCNKTNGQCEPIPQASCGNDRDCGNGKVCISNVCKDKSALCDQVKCANSHYICQAGQCIPDCGTSICGGACCGDDQVCFNNQCIQAPSKPSGSSNYLCQTQPTGSPEYCPANQGCLSKPDGSGDHCVAFSNACDNVTTFCRIGEVCDKTYGHCVKLATTKICRLGQIGTQQKEVARWSGAEDPVYETRSFNQVMSTPAVADIDPRHKGSEIIVTAFSGASDKDYTYPGILRVFSSVPKSSSRQDPPELEEIWNSRTISKKFFTSPNSTPAIGDINGDGKPDIVIDAWENSGDSGRREDDKHTLLAISGDGRTQYFNVPFGKYYKHTANRWNDEADSFGVMGPMLSDLDEDGHPEIIAHHLIYDYKGNLKCILHEDSASNEKDAPFVFAAIDFDGDGRKELITERGVFSYESNGCRLLAKGEITKDFPTVISVADLDGNGTPELVGVNDKGQLTYEEVNVATSGGKKTFTRRLLQTVTLPINKTEAQKGVGSGFCDNPANQTWDHRRCLVGGGKPNIADFDGDGKPEIGIATRYYYTVTKPDLAHNTSKILWAYPVNDFSSAGTSSSVFDFDGDGKAEVVYNDENNLYVFRGEGNTTNKDADGNGINDGEALITIPNTTGTRREYPVIVDVNGDGHANIVVSANDFGAPADKPKFHGIRIFADADNQWVSTRKIWNQFAYYVTNINNDGTVPQHEKKNWEQPWLNNYLQNVQAGDLTLAPDLAAVIKSAFHGNCRTGQANTQLIFDIKNLGDANVAAHSIKYKVVAKRMNSGREETADLGSGENTTAIPAKGVETVTFDWTVPTGWEGSELKIEVTVDSENSLPECDETNNTAVLENVMTVPPNLYVEGDVVSSGTCASGFRFQYKVKNDSSVAIPANKVKVVIYAGLTESAMSQISEEMLQEEIPANGEVDKTFTWQPSASFQNTPVHFKIVVDEDNQLTECREDDNTLVMQPVACYNLG